MPARPSADLDARALVVLTLVEERLGELVGRIVAGVQEFYEQRGGQMPVSGEEMAANASVLVQTAIRALREGRPPNDDEIAVARALGERRATQGVSLESVLRGLRVGAKEALLTIQQVAADSVLDVPATIGLTSGLWEWIDEVSVAVADAHRHIELARARSDEQQRAGLVNALVLGTLDPRRIGEQAAPYGLSADADHVVVCARPAADAPAEALERLLVPRTWSAGVAGLVGDDLVAVLPGPPGEPLPVPAGIGPAAPLGGLPRSYRAAVRALEAAVAFDIPGGSRLQDLAFPAAVLADEQLSGLLADRYLAPARDLGAFGEELLESLRVYAAHRQNVEAAAQQLHVHSNTLRHRLSRYEEAAGMSLRDPRQLAELWWALVYDQRRGSAAP